MKSLKPVRSLCVPASCGLQTLAVKGDETPAAAHVTTSSRTHQAQKGGGDGKAGRGEDRNFTNDKGMWGSKEDRMLHNQLDNNNEKNDNRDISHKDREGKDHWRKVDGHHHHHQERKSRLEVPGSSSSKIRSRSRSRSKSPMECTWRLIEEEHLEESNCNNFMTGGIGSGKGNSSSNRVKKVDTKIPRTAYTGQQPNKVEAMVASNKTRKAQLKLSIPPPPPHPPRSPGSQRLSNMVSGSSGGQACLQSLKPDKTATTKKNKKVKKEYKDDLGSPSSITPFIFTPTTTASVR